MWLEEVKGCENGNLRNGGGRAIRTRYSSLERTVREGFENLTNEIRRLKEGKDPDSRREEEIITSGGGAFLGMVIGGGMGLLFGPAGVIIGGVIGAILGDQVERESIRLERRRRARKDVK